MKIIERTSVLAVALLGAVGGPTYAQNADIEQLKATVQQMQKTINEQNARIAELEKAKAGKPTAPTATEKDKSLAEIVKETEQPGTTVGHQSPVTYRATLKDEQEAAPRPNDLVMD